MALTQTERNARWRERHPEKVAEYQRKNRDRQVAHSRRSHLKIAYGITPEQFEQMAADQEHRCAICDEAELHVDHDHETGEVRGLLCGKCNKGLGMFNDRPELLRGAAHYLERYA